MIERNEARNAAIVFGQAHRQNTKAWDLSHEGNVIDPTNENHFYPLPMDVFKKIGFFAAGSFSKTYEKYFNRHSSSLIGSLFSPLPTVSSQPKLVSSHTRENDEEKVDAGYFSPVQKI